MLGGGLRAVKKVQGQALVQAAANKLSGVALALYCG